MPGWAGVPPMVSPDPVKVAGRDRPGGSVPATTLSVPPAWWLVEQVPGVGLAYDGVGQHAGSALQEAAVVAGCAH